MLFLILIWIYLFSASWLLGTLTLDILKAHVARIGDQAILSCYIGLIVFGSFFLVFSLFAALRPLIGFCFSFPVFCYLLVHETRQKLKCLWASLSLDLLTGLIILFLAVAFYSVQIVTWYDTGLYHYGIVQWLSKYGSVYGLALVHNRFGFTSSWFPLTAPMNYGVLTGRVSTVTGGAILFLALLHFIISLMRVIQQRCNAADLFLAACIPLAVSLPLLFKMPASLSPDFPCIIFISVVGWLFLLLPSDSLNYSVDRQRVMINNNMLPVIFSAAALSIKLSAIPAVAISLLYYWDLKKYHINKILLSFSIILLFLMPVMLAGIKISGCPLYPIPFCFDVPWSVGSENARNMSLCIEQFARWRSSYPPMNMSFGEWIVYWYHLALVNKITALLIIISLIILILLAIFRSCRLIPGIIWTVFLGISGTLFLIYKAPDWRFGWAYLVVIPSLAAQIVYRKNSGIQASRHLFSSYVLLFFIASTVCVASLLYKTDTEKGLFNALKAQKVIVPPNNMILIPPKLISFQCTKGANNEKGNKCSILEIVSHKINGIEYLSPESTDQCWASPIPCSPSLLSGIQLKNPLKGVAAGFIKEPQ